MLDQLRILTDYEYYAAECLKIRTKRMSLIPLILNQPQRLVHLVVSSTISAGKIARFIILKARQEGVSTYVGSLLFWRTALRKYVSTVVMAHKEDPSIVLFDMYNTYYHNLPEEACPLTTYSSKKELIFADPANKAGGMQSRLNVFTAGSVDISRSRTIHNLHWSEVAMTPDAEATNDAILSCVPKTPETFVAYESTANGASGLFYDLYQSAAKGENEWVPIFLPWFLMEEYRLPVPQGFILDSDEEKIKDLYSLSLEQMSWRRWTLLNDFGGRIDKFMREYPSCPEEAFTTPESRVFDSSALLDMESHVCQPTDRVTVTEMGLVSSLHGKIKMWRAPEMGGAYVIGVDAAGGKESGDLLVAQVMRVHGDGRLEQVAVLSDKVHPVAFAGTVWLLAKTYNNALVVPESNYHGVAVIHELQTRGTCRIFRDTTGEDGIQVSKGNRYLLVDLLAQAIVSRRVIVHDHDTIAALKSYQERNERFFGPNDDFVDSLRLVTYALTRTSVQPPVLEAPRGWNEKWTEEDWDRYIANATKARRRF